MYRSYQEGKPLFYVAIKLGVYWPINNNNPIYKKPMGGLPPTSWIVWPPIYKYPINSITLSQLLLYDERLALYSVIRWAIDVIQPISDWLYDPHLLPGAVSMEPVAIAVWVAVLLDQNWFTGVLNSWKCRCELCMWVGASATGVGKEMNTESAKLKHSCVKGHCVFMGSSIPGEWSRLCDCLLYACMPLVILRAVFWIGKL